MQTETVDLAEMRRELQWKESKIAELTCVVQSKDNIIADMEVSYSTLVMALSRGPPEMIGM